MSHSDIRRWCCGGNALAAFGFIPPTDSCGCGLPSLAADPGRLGTRQTGDGGQMAPPRLSDLGDVTPSISGPCRIFRRDVARPILSADKRPNGRSLPTDLVRDGQTRPVVGSIAGRNPAPSTSARCAKAPIAEASGRRQHRSTAVCRALSLLPQSAGRAEKLQAGDDTAPASRGFAGVLGLEVTLVRRSAKDPRGRSPVHSRLERCQPAVGSATDRRFHATSGEQTAC